MMRLKKGGILKFLALFVVVLALALAAAASAMQPPVNEDPGGGTGNPGYACNAYMVDMLEYLHGPVFGDAWYVCQQPVCGYYIWSSYYNSWFINWIGYGELDCKNTWAFRYLWG